MLSRDLGCVCVHELWYVFIVISEVHWMMHQRCVLVFRWPYMTHTYKDFFSCDINMIACKIVIIVSLWSIALKYMESVSKALQWSGIHILLPCGDVGAFMVVWCFEEETLLWKASGYKMDLEKKPYESLQEDFAMTHWCIWGDVVP